VALAATTAACSDDTEPVPSSSSIAAPTTTVAATSTTVVETVATIDAAVLGAGFTARPDSRPLAEVDAELRAECPAIARIRAAHDVAQRERSVIAAADPLPVVRSDVTRFADLNGAAATFNALAGDAMLRCLPRLVAASGLVLDDVTTQRVPVDPAGDAAAAIRLDGTAVVGGLASRVQVELIVVVRDARLHVVLTTASDLYPLRSATRAAIVEAAGA
jgi:hypothetical protein